MKLLTKAILKTLPPLYAQEEKEEKIVYIKFFTPDANWTWYVLEGSEVDENGYFDTDKPKVDFMFFGLVDGFEAELGYFSLKELQAIRGQFGLPVERDLYFTPTPLTKV